MVTFVATTENYKELADKQKSDIRALESSLATYDQRFMEKSSQMEELRENYAAKVNQLESRLSDLSVEKNKVQTELYLLKAEKSSWAASIEGFERTIANNTESLELRQKALNKALDDLIKLRAQLNTSELSQYEKNVQIQKLQAQAKHLLEEKASLEEKIEAVSSGMTGTEADIEPRTVTKVPSQATPAMQRSGAEDLKGTVVEVSPSLVVISLGSADGVAKGTVFHVTRGEEFICNIKVTNVEVNKSAGVKELVMEQPRVGDTVNTRL